MFLGKIVFTLRTRVGGSLWTGIVASKMLRLLATPSEAAWKFLRIGEDTLMDPAL